MTAFLVNQTKSYTLAVNAETGELHIELSDELKENLKEQASDAETNADMFGLTLDLMGKDSPEYLAAMDELMGTGGTLADAYIHGGTEAVIAAVADVKGDAFASSKDLADRAADSNLFDAFADRDGSGMEAITGYGMPDDGSDADLAAIEAAAGQEGLMAGWGTAAGFIVLVGVAGYFVAKAYKEKMDKEVNHIPADPNEPEFNFAEWLERPWAEESLDPTFGETMPGDPSSDPNEGIHKEEYTKEFEPEAELDGVVMWDKDRIEDAITAAEAQEAAEFAIVSTTLPVEPEFQFKTEFGGEVPGQGGEDFNEDPAMATATEYIVGKMEGGLYVEDTMMFKENVQTGVVETEGTSGGVLEGQLNEAETGVHVHVEML